MATIYVLTFLFFYDSGCVFLAAVKFVRLRPFFVPHVLRFTDVYVSDLSVCMYVCMHGAEGAQDKKWL